MTPLRHHMIDALPLRGQGERTQEASGREVRLLSECSSSSPARIAAPALQQSFRPRKHGDTLAPNSLRIGSRGLRFFSPPVLTRDWHPLALLRAATARRLPTVLRVPEVRRLLNAAPLHHQVSFTTLSSVGLRLPAGLCLQGGAIDSQRMLGHVHRGQGAKDRSGPLPHATLGLLRHSWATPRNPLGLFPAPGREQTPSATAPEPMSRNAVQGACRHAQQRAAMNQGGGALPTLRPAYATPLLAAGVHLRLIPLSLGHTRLDTTRLSLPLTHKGHAEAAERIPAVLRGLTSCPPSLPSSMPVLQRIVRVLPLCLPHTTRPAAPSHTAQPDRTDPASLRATAVPSSTASLTLVALGLARRVCLTPPHPGSTTHAHNTSQAPIASSPAPSLRPDAPFAVRLNAWPPPLCARLLPQLSNGSLRRSAVSAPTCPVFLASSIPGADSSRTPLTSIPSSQAAASPRTAPPGSPPAPPSLSPFRPSRPSPAPSAKTR